MLCSLKKEYIQGACHQRFGTKFGSAFTSF